MPTVLRSQGFRLYFWSHEPPHIHVDRGGASAKVWLEPVALASNTGYPAQTRNMRVSLSSRSGRHPAAGPGASG